MSQYEPKMITMSIEEYEGLLAKIALLEVRVEEQKEATKDACEYNGHLQDWLYAYKACYKALTDKYCLPCTVGWKFSGN